jgi:hypothetical protein
VYGLQGRKKWKKNVSVIAICIKMITILLIFLDSIQSGLQERMDTKYCLKSRVAGITQ